MPRIYTARYLLQADGQLLENAALLEDQGRILRIDQPAALQREVPAATWVDYLDALILPTFINAHTHLELSLYPQWASAAGVVNDSCGFVDWILRLVKVKRSIKPDSLCDAVSHGLQLSLQAGTAALGDILSNFAAGNLYAQSPLCGRVFLETLGQDREFTQQLYKKLDRQLKKGKTGRFEQGISPHSPYTIRPNYMNQLYRRCHSDGLSCCTHIAESAAEVDFLDSGGGELVERFYSAINWHQYRPPARHIRPLDFLQQQGGLFANHLLIHGVQLTAPEIETIASQGATLVLCPRSNAHLQVGTAPVAVLKKAGVKLALGTDSLASNQSLSLWDEMAFAAQVYENAFSPRELLALATTEGAAALGLKGQLGDLRPGFRCSFQVVRPASFAPPHLLIEQLIRAGQGMRPEAVVLDGTEVFSQMTA
jgi:cytosine/adenosine deaminase-related metal-dependent hydrolase